MFNDIICRFFGNAKPSSDYDFFVEYSEELMIFLDLHGFIHQNGGNGNQYGDMSIHSILGLYDDYDREQMWPFIHIQVITPSMMQTKKTVNKFFKDKS